MDILFLDLKESPSFNLEKTGSNILRQKMWLINIYGAPATIAESGKATQIMAKSFSIFPAGKRFSDF
jgi:hypothetical protein